MATQRFQGRNGLPVLGESIPLITDPHRFAQQRKALYGPIFKTNIQGRQTITMVSAEAQRYILGTNHRNFRAGAGYEYLDAFLGGAVLLLDGEPHARLRRQLAPAFHQRSMAGYLATINRYLDQQLEQWGSQGTRSFLDEVRQVTFKLASALLVGIEVGPEYEQLLKLWSQYSLGLFAIVKLNAPFTTYGRALRAQKQIEELIKAIIVRRRGQSTTDALSLLINTYDEAEGAMTEADLIAQIKLLIFAGYDTTSGTSTWMMVELLRHPELLERVRAEIHAEAGDAPITLDDLREKPFLDAFINETLRLHPQQPLMLRGAIETFDFEGFTIAANTPVMLIPAYTQRTADYFAEPERFDPERFLAPREEQLKTPYAWVGFGGGPHICLGEGIARMEIKALVTRLLRRFDLKLAAEQDFRPLYIPTSRPKGNVLVSYTRR